VLAGVFKLLAAYLISVSPGVKFARMKKIIVTSFFWYFLFMGSKASEPKLFGPFPTKSTCEYTRAILDNTGACFEWKP
jgi:hypothetical protein